MKNVETVIAQGATNATARLICPKGHKIRLVAFSASLSTPTAFDQPVLNITRGGAVNQVLTRVAMPGLQGSETDIAGAIGLADTPNQATNTNPATGDVTYNPNIVALSVALPDVWWPFDIDVRVVTPTGTVDGSVYVYEVAEP